MQEKSNRVRLKLGDLKKKKKNVMLCFYVKHDAVKLIKVLSHDQCVDGGPWLKLRVRHEIRCRKLSLSYI